MSTGNSERKQDLINTAARLFREKGYARATVRDLGKEVGLLSGSLFHHFKTKDEILYAVMEEAISYSLEKMKERFAAAKSTEDKMFACIMTELEALNGETKDGYYVLVFEWRSLSEEGQQKILKLRDTYEAYWAEAFSEAHARGWIAGDWKIMRRFVNGAFAWTPHWFEPDGKLTLEELARQALYQLTRTPFEGQNGGGKPKAASRRKVAKKAQA